MNEATQDVAYGAEAIGRVIGEPNLRRVYYMLERGYVAGAQKVGPRIWILSIPTWRRAVHGEAA
jgi:hypothetical protein